jgi:hypothetical protein
MRARDIIGKKIVAIDQERMNTRDHAGTWSDPVWMITSITFEDSSALYFNAEETDFMPIVTPLFIKAEKKKK